MGLLCLALGSQALTLGRIRGAVLVGKPLDVTVQVQLDASESASSLCFEADVFHADTRQEASRVRVLVDASAQAASANVRILSSALIDEPVVTVYLRSGCSGRTSRRYVLLADFPSELAAPLPAVLIAPSAAPAALAPARGRPLVTAEAPQPALRTGRATERQATKNTSVAATSVKTGAMRKAAPASGRPRLKLDLFELLEEREPTLNFSTEMLIRPSSDPARRSEAAALWQALNASPEETLRQGARVLALEADVNALKSLTAKNQLSLTDLGARLHKAESERFSAWVVYALLASLLACLAALAFVSKRQRRRLAHDKDWWSQTHAELFPSIDASEPKLTPEPRSAPAPQARNPSPQPGQAPVSATAGLWQDSLSASDLDVNMAEVSHSTFDQLLQANATPQTTPVTTAPTGNAPQTRTLPALPTLSQQQGNLLVAQGRPEQAVGILTQHLNDGGRPNPALYLDLISLLHTLGLKTDFLHYREEFGRFFGSKVPEFLVFKNEGRSLEAYPQMLSRIIELWPNPQVLELMETFIFQDPFESKPASLDLAAFRDLLLLYGVAQDIVLTLPAANDEPVPKTLPPPPLLALLDLDLSEPEGAPAGGQPAAITDIDLPEQPRQGQSRAS